jgi:hypothetical protein
MGPNPDTGADLAVRRMQGLSLVVVLPGSMRALITTEAD